MGEFEDVGGGGVGRTPGVVGYLRWFEVEGCTAKSVAYPAYGVAGLPMVGAFCNEGCIGGGAWASGTPLEGVG